ncbi:hypothetical protein HanRHA438_Chr07g0288761 [Helianthus annuus]|nr:hypothetical protein HanHA89_Chr07g0245621 [Helianthus annuus]KAJ0638753.1 hypothetical protein HanHA300_Chr00c0049g0699601 [Helianthus annuus]KAJ0906559.1 hypothetical protein HanRHA438_Chr07g0288761 [Helianthus annuus]
MLNNLTPPSFSIDEWSEMSDASDGSMTGRRFGVGIFVLSYLVAKMLTPPYGCWSLSQYSKELQPTQLAVIAIAPSMTNHSASNASNTVNDWGYS